MTIRNADDSEREESERRGGPSVACCLRSDRAREQPVHARHVTPAGRANEVPVDDEVVWSARGQLRLVAERQVGG